LIDFPEVGAFFTITLVSGERVIDPPLQSHLSFLLEYDLLESGAGSFLPVAPPCAPFATV
jgi:hypothetical protein